MVKLTCNDYTNRFENQFQKLFNLLYLMQMVYNKT